MQGTVEFEGDRVRGEVERDGERGEVERDGEWEWMREWRWH